MHNNDMYKSFLEEVEAGIVVHAADTSILFCNRQAARFLGTTEEKMTGTLAGDPLWRFINEDGSDMPVDQYPINITLKTKSKLEHYVLGIALDGEDDDITWVACSSSPFFDDDGKINHVVIAFWDVTSMMNMQSQLARMERKQRKMISNISDVIAIMSSDGIISYKSPNLEKHFGWRPEELEGMPGWETVHPDDMDLVQNTFQKLLQEDRSTATIKFRYKCKDNSYKHIQLTAKNLIEDSDVKGVLLNYHDISEAAEIENKLLHNTQLMKDTGHIAKVGGWVIDNNGHTLAWTDETFLIHELDMSEQPDVDEAIKFYHPNDRSLVESAVQSAIAEGQSFEYEARLITAKGHHLYVEIAGKPIVRDGVTTGVQGTIQDITARKKLSVYRDLSVDIMQIITELPDFKDAAEKIIIAIKNASGCEAVGLRLKRGEDFPYMASSGFPSEFLVAENSLLKLDEKGGVCRNYDGTIRLECTCGLVLSGATDPDSPLFTRGGSFWTNNSVPLLHLAADEDPRENPRNRCIHDGYNSVALIPIRSKNEIIGLLQLNGRKQNCFTLATIEVLEDVSRHIGDAMVRKRYEDDLLKSNLQLKKALKELESAQTQLIMQERLSALGQMASGIAHDFNNSLMPIIGFSEMLLDDPEMLANKEEAVELLKLIHSAGEDARHIVQRLRLVYTKQSADDVNSVDIAELIKGSISLLQPKWKEEMRAKGATVKMVTLFDDVPMIIANESEIREVFLNLILNALDAMPTGGTVTMKVTADNPKTVVAEVIDTGIGMDQETALNCLDPFFTTKGVEGSGLGLSMVHGIMQRCGGSVEIDAELGKGTTIRLRFPVSTGDEPTDEPVADSYAPAEGMKILVIDDDERSQYALKKTLQSVGHSVELAIDAHDGMAKALSGDFDLIITDRAMPDLSGDDIARAVVEKYPAMPIIMVTGFGDIMKDKGDLPLGVTRLLSKPVTRAELTHCIDEAIKIPKANSYSI